MFRKSEKRKDDVSSLFGFCVVFVIQPWASAQGHALAWARPQAEVKTVGLKTGLKTRLRLGVELNLGFRLEPRPLASAFCPLST